MYSKFVGIDPGADGGIAVLHEDNSLSLYTMPTVNKEVDLPGLFKIIEEHKDGFFGLENIRPFPGMNSASMGKMMWIKGVKHGMIVSVQAPHELVEAKTWQAFTQKGIPILNKNGKKDTKGMALLAAKRLFPKESFLATARSSKPHDGLVDAALIAYYLRMKHGR